MCIKGGLFMKKMMKNILMYLVILVLCSTNVFADGLVNGVQLAVNGEVMFKDLYVYIDNGEVLVPVRCLYESDRYDIMQSSDEIIIQRGFACAKFFINNNRAIINNEVKVLNTFPRVLNNRVYIPLGDLESALNGDVHWDESTGMLDIIEDSLHADEKYRRLDLNEELAAKKFAMSFCDANFKFLERTIISGDECYVFVQYDDEDNLIAVERGCNRIYDLVKDDGIYKEAVVSYSR